jgi:hypothetical protein
LTVIGMLVAIFARSGPTPAMSVSMGGVSVLGAFAVFVLGSAGLGLRMLRPWGKWASAAISVGSIVWGIFQSPGIGVLLSVFVLYLLFGKQGRTVFSAEYQQIIRETPHVRMKTSAVTWVVLAIFVTGMSLFLGYVLFARRV